ncbi:hypothetical protein HK101_001887, partial [Irineochytrium annulatum]
MEERAEHDPGAGPGAAGDDRESKLEAARRKLKKFQAKKTRTSTSGPANGSERGSVSSPVDPEFASVPKDVSSVSVTSTPSVSSTSSPVAPAGFGGPVTRRPQSEVVEAEGALTEIGVGPLQPVQPVQDTNGAGPGRTLYVVKHVETKTTTASVTGNGSIGMRNGPESGLMTSSAQIYEDIQRKKAIAQSMTST